MSGSMLKLLISFNSAPIHYQKGHSGSNSKTRGTKGQQSQVQEAKINEISISQVSLPNFFTGIFFLLSRTQQRLVDFFGLVNNERPTQ